MSEMQNTGGMTPRFPDLAGKSAIVTGASRGIGCGIASVLGAQGMKLVLAARPGEGGEEFTERLAATGVECTWVGADLATADGARQVFDEAINRFGRVDLLVNNAAFKGSKSILELDEELYSMSFERNVRMVYELSYLVARHMVDAAGGNIINISSVGGIRAHRRLAGYDAAKGAIDALTRSMAVDLAPMGVRVNSVAPGATASAPEGFWDKPRRAEKKAELESRIPLGRLATVEDIGNAVAFLASAAASYITGQVLYVDGGITTQLSPPGIRL